MKEETKEAICEVLVEQILKNQISMKNRHIVVDVLKKAGNIKTASKLIPSLNCQHEATLIIAAKIIGYFGDETMIKHLLPLIKSSAQEVQWNALNAIEKILK